MVVASLGIVVRRWVPVRRFESISAALKVILRPSVASAKSSRSCEKTMGFGSSVNMESPGCQGDQSIRPARDDTTALKQRQMAAWLRRKRPGDYEEDHVHSLGAWRNPVDTENLWPEARKLNARTS